MENEKQLIALDDIFPNHCFYVNTKDPMKSLDELINRINNAPKVDAVEVVRCKDCKHWERHDAVGGISNKGYCQCNEVDDMETDDFCSYDWSIYIYKKGVRKITRRRSITGKML